MPNANIGMDEPMTSFSIYIINISFKRNIKSWVTPTHGSYWTNSITIIIFTDFKIQKTNFRI